MIIGSRRRLQGTRHDLHGVGRADGRSDGA